MYFTQKMIMIYEEDLHHKRGEKRRLISFSFLADMVHYKLFFLLVNLAVWAFFFTYLFKV